jgi:Protein of unknown function (DUF2865)
MRFGWAIRSAITFAILSPLLLDPVSAHGPTNDSLYAIFSDHYADASPTSEGNGPSTSHFVRSPMKTHSRNSSAVCVRLCDGAFFPLSGSANSTANHQTANYQDAVCGSLCPDAPTAIYQLPAGSDKIEDAVSSTGSRYTSLPVALRYRTTLDRTCTCHASPARQLAMTRDPTLRKGDFVMTRDGHDF